MGAKSGAKSAVHVQADGPEHAPGEVQLWPPGSQQPFSLWEASGQWAGEYWAENRELGL